MQFILKKRPSVCQFASPLDVDLHNTPQAIILEGKYWKRKWKVITAEYKKWRRYNVTKALGTSNILDTKSELDILEWSTNDNLLMLSDNMSSDTLFSSISQFPFPDSREIARAGRADFIQPSLGPLQPCNFDDFMDFDIDILNSLTNNRLAPVQEVPETEELLKAIEFPMIASIDTMQDIMNSNSSTQQSVIQQANSSQMNVDQQGTSNNGQLLFTATIFTQDMSQSGGGNQQIMSQNNDSSSIMSELNSFINANDMDMSHQAQQAPNNEHLMAPPTEPDVKDAYKGKFSRNNWKAQLPKREPHNYDKVQNTAHQTTFYNQMLAQQQQQAPAPSAQMYNTNHPYGNMTDVNHMSPIQTTTNNFNVSQSVLNLSNSQIYAKNLLMQQQQNLQNQMNIEQQQQQQTMSTTHDNSSSNYKSPQSPSFRSYHHSNQQPYKIPSQNSGYNATSRIIMRQQSPPHQMSGQVCKSMSFQQQQQQQQNATAAAIKEMYRSNSLPINANIQLPKDIINNTCENFVIPKYPNASAATMSSSAVKGRNSRSRSNSINLRHNQLIMTPIQSATSEPTLNASSALAQLLTNSSNTSLIGQKAHSISSSAMSIQQQQQQIQPQRANSFTSSSLVQNSILMAVSSAAANNKQVATSSTSSTPMYQTPTLSPESTYHEGGNSQHETPSLSPERCISIGKYSSSRENNNRRAGHIHAEQKRRYNIKNGFDMLHSLIPQLQQNPNAKLSKAAMLQKGADYIKQLRSERSAITEQMEGLRKEIETLTNSLNHLQNALPANGAPVSRQRTGRTREMYQDYVMQRTQNNWKFWIFGLICEPLLNTFNTTVSTASMDELYRTTMLWIDNSCSLATIRPAVSNKLRELSTTTDILSDNPTTLQEEVKKAVQNATRNSRDQSPR
ncbi:hypothetical protein PVAND_012007 [Polypedilum vanderplanki]|uniref:BHLH domain-containing protein n=1 Tax=Polypedilum vanderplanki TaxID=319348 RepID=A0A9J6CL44_POLVA|nr:hypothetical protein PVAND_012007 [Polypedilum vanderplanki]